MKQKNYKQIDPHRLAYQREKNSPPERDTKVEISSNKVKLKSFKIMHYSTSDRTIQIRAPRTHIRHELIQDELSTLDIRMQRSAFFHHKQLNEQPIEKNNDADLKLNEAEQMKSFLVEDNEDEWPSLQIRV